MTQVKRNVVANYLGSAWAALMSFAFIPLYIRHLGIEAYGLVGVFAVMQSWLLLLDVGLSPTLSREMARFQAGAHTSQSIRDLMFSVELVYAIMAVLIAAGSLLAAPALARHWIHAETLSPRVVECAFMVMGAVIAVRWLSGLYKSAITGLQRQVWLNSCTAAFSTLRGLGVVVVLAYLSNTIVAFFAYQGILAVLEAVALGVQVRRILPASPSPPQFRWPALVQVWHFAAGMAVITLLSILLTQLDKLLLSKMLPLKQFGYYALASTVASAIVIALTPINNAIYPRLVELVAQGETAALADSYHKFSQALTLAVVPAAFILALFSRTILLLWTRDQVTTDFAAPLVTLLVIGNTFNALMHNPYSLQLAYGWTRFTVIANTIAVFLLVPAIYLGVSKFGALAAAIIWIFLNVGYIIVAVPLMHRKLLRTEMWRWYVQDISVPAIAALGSAALFYFWAPTPVLNKPIESICFLGMASLATLSSAVLVTPLGRNLLREQFLRAFKSMSKSEFSDT